MCGITPLVGSISDHFSFFLKRVLNNGHITRFCFVFQVILVILLGEFCAVEEVGLRQISKFKAPRGFVFAKETVKTFFDQMF